MKLVKFDKKSGSVLLVVMIVMIVLQGALMSLLKVAMQRAHSVQRERDSEAAFYLAESAAEYGAYYFDLVHGKLTYGSPFEMTKSVGNGVVSLELKKASGFRRGEIYAEGEVNGLRRAIALKGVRLSTYAQFSFWTHNNRNIYFSGGEEFFGPVHTDSAPYFMEDPVFWDVVSTAGLSHHGSTNAVTFAKGYFSDTEQGVMADVDFDEIKDDPDSLVLRGKTFITINNDEVIIGNSAAGWGNERRSIAGTPVIYVKKNPVESEEGNVVITANSVLDGRLTIVAENNISIKGHITYKDSPLDDPASDDALGLICKNKVIIEKSAPDNVNIHATIMATGTDGKTGTFLVKTAGEGDQRGFINLLGGVVQKERGVVGYVNYSGYAKRYTYDSRFKKKPPPYYPPISGEVTYENWQEITRR